MSDAAEGGAAIAWRLLATLEGGSLLLVASALLAYTAKSRLVMQNHCRRTINSVIITNANNALGRELKRKLESNGCIVSVVTSAATSEAAGGPASKVDALVVVGAERKAEGLDGMAGFVSEDVYDNLKLLECLSSRVKRGGCIAWACAREGVGERSSDPYSEPSAAFDTVLHVSLQHIAKVAHCEPIWVGRCNGSERTAESVVAALLSCTNTQNASRFSIRNAAHRVGEYLGRWLKIVT